MVVQIRGRNALFGYIVLTLGAAAVPAGSVRKQARGLLVIQAEVNGVTLTSSQPDLNAVVAGRISAQMRQLKCV